MDLIAERGIAAHYSGRGVVSGIVGQGPSVGRSSKPKTICLNNTDIALRVFQAYRAIPYLYSKYIIIHTKVFM